MTEQQIKLFTSADGKARLEVTLKQESVWLTQAQMRQLFDTTTENILMHLKNIFRDSELDELATTKEFLVVRQEGKRQVQGDGPGRVSVAINLCTRSMFGTIKSGKICPGKQRKFKW